MLELLKLTNAGHLTRHGRVIGALSVAMVALALGACSSGGGPGRPVLTDSVVPATEPDLPTSPGNLDFFDAVAARPLVCHDEAIHAVLLLGNGLSAPTAADRAALAGRLGYIANTTQRPAREAATIGEVSQMLVAVIDGGSQSRTRVSQEQAMTRLAGRGGGGLVPANARPHQGLTGAQLVTMLGGARAAMGDRARTLVRWDDRGPVVPVPTERSSAAVASAEGGSFAGEPLPTAATDPAIERAADKPMPPPRPASSESARTEPTPVPAPDEPAAPTPLPPAEPAAARPPSPVQPAQRIWVPGKPLKKPGQ